MAGNDLVPHLSLLGVRRDALAICYNGDMEQQSKHYKISRSTPEDKSHPTREEKSCPARESCPARNDVFNEISWPHSWDEYVRGNVVSDSSAALITSFLLKTMSGSGEKSNAEESEADESEDDTDFPPLQIPGPRLQELLKPDIKMPQSSASTTLSQKLIVSAKKKCRKI